MIRYNIQLYWTKLYRHKAAFLGVSIIFLFLLIGILAPILAPHDPMAQSIEKRKSAPLSHGYVLGSDELGRDILSRIIWGARISMGIGIVSVVFSFFIGTSIGLVSAYYGGWLDSIIMCITDIMFSFPYILLTIVIVAFLGPSVQNAMLAIGIANTPRFVRIVRVEALREKHTDYVLAERALGASNLELIFLTILPNAITPALVQATLSFGEAIISSAALSFLGLSASPPTPEWGLMIASGKGFITTAWWIITFPGIAIIITVLGFNLFADALRDIFDVKSRM